MYRKRGSDMDFFADCRFVLQCNRKGDSDLVTRISGMDLCSEEFLERVDPEKYGYRATCGMHTDVYALKRRGLKSPVNISCGYYEPHTNHEYTVLRDLAKCYRLVRHIVHSHKEVSRHEPSPGRGSWQDTTDCSGQMGYDGEFLTCHRENSLHRTVDFGRFRTEKGEKGKGRIPYQVQGHIGHAGTRKSHGKTP